MAGKFASVKFPEAFVDDARVEAGHMQRSVAGQIEHWARLGRMAEQSLTVDAVRRLRKAEVDKLDAGAREAVLDEIFSLSSPPRPEAEAFFALRDKAGKGMGLDGQGRLVKALPDGGRELFETAPRTRRRPSAG